MLVVELLQLRVDEDEHAQIVLLGEFAERIESIREVLPGGWVAEVVPIEVVEVGPR